MILGTGVSVLAIILVFVLIFVDSIIYLPFIKAYDASLLERRKTKTSEESTEQSNPETVSNKEVVTKLGESINQCIGPLCWSRHRRYVANAITEGAKETGATISASAGAYGSHYEIMKNFDMIILAPQVNSFYEDIKRKTQVPSV